MNLQNIEFLGFGGDDLLLFMVACSALMMFAAVWFGLVERGPGQRRIKGLADRQAALRSGYVAPRRRRERLQPMPTIRQIVTKLNLMRHTQAEKVGSRLAQAGWRSKDAVIRFLFAKLVVPPLFGIIIFVVLYVFELYNLQPHMKLFVSIGAVLLGYYGPEIYVKNKITKRSEALRKSLPDAMDLMVICSEAGLSLDAAFKRIAKELAVAAPEIADELSLTALELGFLPERRKALENLSARVTLSELRAMVVTLMQSERYGTPLAHSLRVLSSELRDQRMMKAEEKAARLPALLTVPMIIFILPPLFVVLLGPAIMDTADALGNL